MLSNTLIVSENLRFNKDVYNRKSSLCVIILTPLPSVPFFTNVSKSRTDYADSAFKVTIAIFETAINTIRPELVHNNKKTIDKQTYIFLHLIN